MPGTPQEHFDDCVGLAMPYIDTGDFKRAVTSLIVNLGLHPGTKQIADSSALTVLALGNMNDSVKFRQALDDLKAKML